MYKRQPQEVTSPVCADDARLGLVERQAPGHEPFGQPCFDLFGLLAGVTQREQVIGLCRLPGYAAWAVLLLVRPVSGVVHAA